MSIPFFFTVCKLPLATHIECSYISVADGGGAQKGAERCGAYTHNYYELCTWRRVYIIGSGHTHALTLHSYAGMAEIWNKERLSFLLWIKIGKADKPFLDDIETKKRRNCLHMAYNGYSSYSGCRPRIDVGIGTCVRIWTSNVNYVGSSYSHLRS